MLIGSDIDSTGHQKVYFTPSTHSRGNQSPVPIVDAVSLREIVRNVVRHGDLLNVSQKSTAVRKKLYSWQLYAWMIKIVFDAFIF